MRDADVRARAERMGADARREAAKRCGDHSSSTLMRTEADPGGPSGYYCPQCWTLFSGVDGKPINPIPPA
jgi:hypothetical protein